MITYEVQGRRTVREGGRVREIVRLRTASSSSAAYEIAETMVADDLKVWVFEKTPQLGSTPTYRLLRIVA